MRLSLVSGHCCAVDFVNLGYYSSTAQQRAAAASGELVLLVLDIRNSDIIRISFFTAYQTPAAVLLCKEIYTEKKIRHRISKGLLVCLKKMESRPTKTAASSAAAATSTTRQQQRVTDLRAAKHISLLLVVASSVGCCGATGIISSTTGGGAAATAFVPTPSVLWSTKTTINTVGTNAVNFNARSTHRYWHHSAAGSSGSSSRFAPARMGSTVVSRDTEVVAEAPIAVATDAGSSAALAGLGSSSGSSVGATATAAASAAAANILGSQTVAAADRTTAAAAAAVPSSVSLGPTTAAVAATSTQGGKEGDLVVAGAVSGAAAAAVRVKRRAALALPGTWCVTGLPKWMRILRRRMITKEDWLHVHAASGLVRDSTIL